MARFSASNTIDCVQVGRRRPSASRGRDTPPAPRRRGTADPERQHAPQPLRMAFGEADHRLPQLREPRAPRRAAAPRSGDQVPRSSRCATMTPPAKSTSAATAPSCHGRAQRHGGSVTATPTATMRDRRGGVDQVVHRQRRHRLAGRQSASCASSTFVGSLATRPERRDAADRVASQEGAEGRAERQAHLGTHAQPPGLRAQAEPEARQRQDRRSRPAPTRRTPSTMIGSAHAADGVGEEEGRHRAPRPR